MSLRPMVRQGVHRLIARRVVATTLGAVLAAGCSAVPAAPAGSTSVPGASVTTTTAATSPPVTPPTTPPTGSPVQTPASPAPGVEPELPASPPTALLAGAADAVAPGALGSYTWGDGGSDSPWIVVRPGGAAGGTGPWTVSFDPAVPVGTWTAAWARIRDGRPGPIDGYEQGASGPIAFGGPAGSGPWTLKVEVVVAGAGSAVYYWRLDPAR